MNIFYVEANAALAARSLCDKHVVKMILESAQLLSSAHEKPIVSAPRSVYNHPCAKWVRLSHVHYRWLLLHMKELLNEYTFRYGKAHAYEKYVSVLADTREINFSQKFWTDPPLAMPVEYHSDTAVDSYRHYYRVGKRHLHSWTKRGAPTWLNQDS